MIIQSIRLKNIKSFGEGPDGKGVTVSFQPGVNRIAGLNGHGKTTFIESLGYALFLAEPVFEENFRTDTYFLRHDAAAGEIDVTFSFQGETYRIERGLGQQSKRRPKVIQTSDGSICAEGDKEVLAYLCRLLGLPSQERLTEMFSKLIGVKQGRLTWPFDSKTSDAKRFFEPLLDVEVFRQCYDRLRPVVAAFEKEQEQYQRKEAAVAERIRDRADSQEKLPAARKAVDELTVTISDANKALEAALHEKQKHDQFAKAANDAKAAWELSNLGARTAKDRRLEAEKRVSEAETAAATVAEFQPKHAAYENAEAALKELETKRRTRDGLQKKRSLAETDRKTNEGRATAAREQQALLVGQQAQKVAQHKSLTDTIAALHAELDSSKDAFAHIQQAGKVAADDLGLVKAWVQGLPRHITRLGTAAAGIAKLDTELSAWDPAKIAAARQTEKSASEATTAAKESLAQARERKTTLAEQLRQIGGGLCPFLKETCRQFDPAKVQTDLTGLESEVGRLEKLCQEAQRLNGVAQKTLTPLVTAENQLTAKHGQLSRDIADYAAEFGTVVSVEAVEADKRLRAWQIEIPASPQGITLPKEDLTANHVAKLQPAAVAHAAEISAWWTEVQPKIREHLNEVERVTTERTRKEEILKNLTHQLTNGEKELSQLGKDAEAKKQEAGTYDAQVTAFQKVIVELDEQLQPYAGLDGEIETQTNIRSANQLAHELYLRSKALADDLGPRRESLLTAQSSETKAADALAVCEATLKRAQESFDPEKLKLAREEYDRKLGEATAAATHLNHAKDELARQESRFSEWVTAVHDRDLISQEIARCQAAIDLTELARKTLRDAAPTVAQHLCNRIAGAAQAIFNQINPDPVELKWLADNYSLRITPGDRRFAMLSGGEQTKLALALTLAMVREFSGLRFCIFDEPTYGVDANSRPKLADAIIQAQAAAELDQLLLVSHDDAFEGKIEHAILLEKTAATGSRVVLSQ